MKDFNPGFRLSKFDNALLTIGVFAAVFLWPSSVILSTIVVFVLGHFFLFCNVFRFSRTPELIWAATCTISVFLSLNLQLYPVHYVFLLQCILTLALLIFEVRKPGYHGVFWNKWNPNLRSWFESRDAE